MTNYNKDKAKEIASGAVAAGFRAYIAERGNYGFFTNGLRVVSFQVNCGVSRYSGNYGSRKCGTGWVIGDIDGAPNYAKLLAMNPPKWATKGEKVSLTTPQQQLDAYGPSSRYAEVTA